MECTKLLLPRFSTRPGVYKACSAWKIYFHNAKIFSCMPVKFDKFSDRKFENHDFCRCQWRCAESLFKWTLPKLLFHKYLWWQQNLLKTFVILQCFNQKTRTCWLWLIVVKEIKSKLRFNIQSVTKIYIYPFLKYVFFADISGTTWAIKTFFTSICILVWRAFRVINTFLKTGDKISWYFQKCCFAREK